MIQKSLQDIFDLLCAKDLTFALYALPGMEVNIVVGESIDTSEVDFSNKDGFLYRSFSKKKKSVLIQGDFCGLVQDFPWQKYDALADQIRDEKTCQNSDLSKQDYLNRVEELIAEIRSGSFQKLVFSRSEKVASSKGVMEIFDHLLSNHSKAFNYILRTEDGEIWLGASPEILLEKNEQGYRTVALAGTVSNVDSDNLFSKKNKGEQQLVTDFIQNKLVDSGAKNIIVSEAQAHQAANVIHIKSGITFDLKRNNLREIIELAESLHPTPAVGGTPQSKAESVIEKFENYDRGLYAGYLGPTNLNNTSLYVNIRCARYLGNQIELYVGGGIVRDSDPLAEWEETINKAKLMLEASL